jgi:hypothetical protein
MSNRKQKARSAHLPASWQARHPLTATAFSPNCSQA